MGKPAGLTMDARSGTGQALEAIELLVRVGPWALDLLWTVDAEFAGDPTSAQTLNDLATSGDQIDCVRLAQLLSCGPQVVDGELRGSGTGGHASAICIRSVRGDHWDIEANSDALAAIRAHFPEAVALPA